MDGKIFRSYLAFEMKIMMAVHFYGKYQQEKRKIMKIVYKLKKNFVCIRKDGRK